MTKRISGIRFEKERINVFECGCDDYFIYPEDFKILRKAMRMFNKGKRKGNLKEWK